jgi:hypothetical protein
LAVVQLGSIRLELLPAGPRKIDLVFSSPTTRSSAFYVGVFRDDLDAVLVALRAARAGMHEQPKGRR